MSISLLVDFFEVSSCFSFFFNDTATTEIYTLSLHDALPISRPVTLSPPSRRGTERPTVTVVRSEEHTSELQSHVKLVCRLLLEKNKTKTRMSSDRYLKTSILQFGIIFL